MLNWTEGTLKMLIDKQVKMCCRYFDQPLNIISFYNHDTTLYLLLGTCCRFRQTGVASQTKQWNSGVEIVSDGFY